MSSQDCFRDPAGTRHSYTDLALSIRNGAPHSFGTHISAQPEAIGLYGEFMKGAPPRRLRFTLAETTCPLVVPSGSPLAAGKLYLQLYHGRKDPAEELDDWGFVGPTFGPLSCVVQTYFTTLRLHGLGGQEIWLDQHDDLIVWEGSYFGDMSVFIAHGDEHG